MIEEKVIEQRKERLKGLGYRISEYPIGEGHAYKEITHKFPNGNDWVSNRKMTSLFGIKTLSDEDFEKEVSLLNDKESKVIQELMDWAIAEKESIEQENKNITADNCILKEIIKLIAEIKSKKYSLLPDKILSILPTPPTT